MSIQAAKAVWKEGEDCMEKSGMQETNRMRKSRTTIRRTHAGDAANIFVRCILSDISDMLGGCSVEQIEQTIQYFDYKCPYTGQDIYTIAEGEKLAFDHLIPHDKESCGLNLYGNIIATTDTVHIKKGAKDFKDFIKNDTDGSDEEKAQRIKKIEQFQQESGYFQKIKNTDEIKALCKEQYDVIQEQLKNLKSEYMNLLSIRGHDSGIERTSEALSSSMPKHNTPVQTAAAYTRTYTFTNEHFISYMKKIRQLSPSTAQQYAAAVQRILQIENLSFEQLQSNIDRLVQEYGTGGSNEELGRTGHNTWISALKRVQNFAAFLQDQQC
jgi:hypothetical protein